MIAPNFDPQLLQLILDLKSDIDQVAMQLYTTPLQTHESTTSSFVVKVFGDVEILPPPTHLSECYFHRLISWLYTLYWEKGKKSDIQFLVDRFVVYEIDQGVLSQHHHAVRAIRTVNQHDISTSGISLKRTVRDNCTNWFERICGRSMPTESRDWEQCLSELVVESEGFFLALQKCLHQINQDESRDEILREWMLRRTRRFSIWEYDDLIREVMADLGIYKEVVELRNRFASKWDIYLKTVPIGADMRREIKQKILDTLLADSVLLMPIDQHDLFETFAIEPGNPLIRKMLIFARSLFQSDSRLDHAALLEKLQAEFENLKPSKFED